MCTLLNAPFNACKWFKFTMVLVSTWWASTYLRFRWVGNQDLIIDCSLFIFILIENRCNNVFLMELENKTNNAIKKYKKGINNMPSANWGNDTWKSCNFWPNNKTYQLGATLWKKMLNIWWMPLMKPRGVSHCDLAIYIKKYLKAKKKWRFKYFTMSKYNLQKIPLKETKILPNIITL